MDQDSGAPPPDDQEDEKKRVREPSEGVRIIGAEEAAEAAGRRDVVSRLPEGSPRLGDRPEGAGGEQPPPVRLPAREADDPNTFGAVPIISPGDPPPAELSGEAADEPTASFEIPDVAPTQAADEDDLSRILGGRRDRTRGRSRRRGRRGHDEGAAGAPTAPVPPSDPGASPSTGEVELPHWTKPPTGEVPQVVSGEPPPTAVAQEGDEDLNVWAGLSSEPRWRDEGDRGDEPDIVQPPPPPPRPTPPPPPPSFDEQDVVGAPTEPIEPEPSVTASAPYPESRRGEHPLTGDSRRGDGGSDRDLPTAVLVGVGLLALFLILAQIGSAALMLLVLAVIVMAAAEFFSAVRRVGYHPAVLPGLVGTGAMVLAVHWKSEAGFALVTFLLVAVLMLWYVIGLAHERAVANIGVTLLGVMWIGGLGSFAGLMLAIPFGPDNGIAFLGAAIFATVAYDVGALFVGRQMGKTPLSPASPNKTVEGLVGGAFAAIVVSTIYAAAGPSPWELVDGLVLGLAVAIVAPVGDLCESMLKRDLGIKDMGTMLPGHGGLLDRFDALLFVLPTTYYVVLWLDVVANQFQ